MLGCGIVISVGPVLQRSRVLSHVVVEQFSTFSAAPRLTLNRAGVHIAEKPILPNHPDLGSGLKVRDHILSLFVFTISSPLSHVVPKEEQAQTSSLGMYLLN